MNTGIYDVIMAGGGPAGSAAARRCAIAGFNTLLLEKAKLPRVKCCTGMIMSRLSQTTIKEEFGEIPQEALTEPQDLEGFMIYVPGVGREVIAHKAPFTWRKELDYWMNRKVRDAGGEIWEEVRVISFTEAEGGYELKARTREGVKQLKARWLIGTDGAHSTVRKILFPAFKVNYGQAIQEYHHSPIYLEKGWAHLFFPAACAPSYFGTYHKGDYIVVDGGARMGQMKGFLQLAKETIARDYGFDINSLPHRKDACIEPTLYRELLSGQFVPAKGNALLAGDAAGLLVPVSGEGIGLALKSGFLAAEAVIEASKKRQEAENFYIRGISAIIETMKEFYNRARNIREKARQGEPYLVQVADAWKKTLEVA